MRAHPGTYPGPHPGIGSPADRSPSTDPAPTEGTPR